MTCDLLIFPISRPPALPDSLTLSGLPAKKLRQNYYKQDSCDAAPDNPNYR